MSSLIFKIENQQIFIATDTLATSPEGTPSHFTTKAFPIPHLRLVIAGTGVAGFLESWLWILNSLPVSGIEGLEHEVGHYLSALWKERLRLVSFPKDRLMTTTIYHFGFSEKTEEKHAYACRSDKGFIPETLPAGTAVKPECDVPKVFVFPRDLRSMMENQRTRQLKRPLAQRVHIGGAIQVHHLTRAGTSIYSPDRLADFDETRSAILAGRDDHS